MVYQIEKWINETLSAYENEKKSCKCFSQEFYGYYTKEFLSKCSFVVLKNIPKPDTPELRQAGLGKFLDMDIEGITYKNTYFIKSGHENNLTLHFHELVHVLQWQYLGTKEFISRYINELDKYSYENAPLEKMAYSLEKIYQTNNKPMDISQYVKNAI